MKGIAVFVVVLVAALGIYGFVVTRPAERGLDANALAWVRKYIEWRNVRWKGIFDAYEGIDGDLTRRKVDRLFAPLESCSRSYEGDVGAAPGSLRSIEDATLNACSKGEAAILEFDTSGLSALRSMKSHLFEGHRALVRASSRLDERLIMTKPLPELGGEVAESRVEPRLSRAATRISAFRTDIRCWSEADWPDIRREIAALNPEYPRDTFFVGVAGIWEGAANLWPGACSSLVRFAYGESRPTSGTALEHLAEAFQALGHEVAHATGAADEALAECRGLQYVRPLSLRLGASRAYASRLAEHAWERYKVDEFYFSPHCRSGGLFDQDRGDIWP